MQDQAIQPARQFRDFLSHGRFMIQRSRSSGRFVFYPRVAEPGTGSGDLEWVEASGAGVVYATTVQRNRPPTPDLHLCLVDLAEGPRMMSRVEDIAPTEVRIGMPVRAVIRTQDSDPFVVFVPATEAAA